jgi:hypothetical protein
MRKRCRVLERGRREQGTEVRAGLGIFLKNRQFSDENWQFFEIWEFLTHVFSVVCEKAPRKSFVFSG